MDWKVGLPVLVGERVSWLRTPQSQPETGIIRWIGNIPEVDSTWTIGLEMDDPLPDGGCGGFWKDRKLFECHTNRGLIVPIRQIRKLPSKSDPEPGGFMNNLAECKLNSCRVESLRATEEITKANEESGEVQLDHINSDSKFNDDDRLSKNDLNERKRRNNLFKKYDKSILRLKHNRFLKTKAQESKTSLKINQRKRLSLRELDYDLLSRKFEDDLQLVRKSLDACSYFTINQFFDTPRNPDSTGDMNDVVGYFKEINEDQVTSHECKKPINECEKQLGGLLALDYHGASTSHHKEKKFFSFLKWFKKNKQNSHLKLNHSSVTSSPVLERKPNSSCESLDTIFSTQTVRSFAYIPPTQYHPSAPSSSLLGLDKQEYSTPGNNMHPPREKKKKRKAPDPPSPFARRITRENSLPTTLQRNQCDQNADRTFHRRTVSESFKDKKAGAYCHVQGKKKAPLPPPKPSHPSLYPDLQKLNPTLHKKKNPAPPPPNKPKNDKTPQHPLASNFKTPPDLTPLIEGNSSPKPSLSPLSSRPWYKRTQKDPGHTKSFIKRDLLKGFDNKKNRDVDDWTLDAGYPRRSLSTDSTLTKFTIFPKLEKPDDKKKEDKRKSQISILTNITELDKEAAEILRKEQAEEKKIMAEKDAKYYSPTPIPKALQDIHHRQVETSSTNSPTDLHFPNPIHTSQQDPTPTPDPVSKETPSHQKTPKTTNAPQIPPTDPTTNQNPSDATDINTDKNINHFNVRNKHLRYLNEPWVCTKCTLENPGWRVFCEICTSVKPHFLYNANKTCHSKDKANNQLTQHIEGVSTHFLDPHPEREIALKKLPNKHLFTTKPDKSPASQDDNNKQPPTNQPQTDQQKFTIKSYHKGEFKNNGKQEPEKTDTIQSHLPTTEQDPTPGNSHQDQHYKPIKQTLTTENLRPSTDANKVLEAYVITQTTVLEDIIIRKSDSNSQPMQQTPKGKTPSQLKHLQVLQKSAKSKAANPIDLTPAEEQYGKEFEELASKLTRAEGLADFKATMKTMDPNTTIHTVPVNKLLKNLEAAINTGDQVVAARLARELALLKIDCNVTRQETSAAAAAAPSKITVDMYVEDKVSHQGPIQVTVSPSMTLLQLKKKVHQELGIPVNVQRWILGKRLATDDTKTLESDGVKNESCPVFLYLITPDEYEAEKGSNNQDIPFKDEHHGMRFHMEENRTCEQEEKDSPVKPNETHRGTEKGHSDGKKSGIELIQDIDSQGNTSQPKRANASSQNSDADRRKGDNDSQRPTSIFRLTSRDGENEVEKELKLISANSVKQKIEQLNKTFEENSRKEKSELISLGSWKCLTCTYVNSAGRQICFACSANKADQKPKAEEPEESNLARVQNETKLPIPSNIHYDQLIKLQDSDVVPNLEAFYCTICLMDYPPGDGIVLKDCLHTFCRPCLINTVQYSDDAEVKCPYLDEKYSCTSVLQQREIKALVPQKVFDQHLAKSVKEAENKIGNAFHCKTPDCKGWCIFEDNVNEFHCPVCNMNNCLTCYAIHTGINCKEYQERMKDASDTDADAKKTRDMLEEMVLKGEAMGCPKCQVILMKKWGCDWLRCSMCKTEICWVTRGFRWGPAGKGDTSAGCKCGVNGIKCHPKCNYCH